MRASDLEPGVELHRELNPRIWDPMNHMRPEVRHALLKVALKFYHFLEVPVEVKDVIVTGSQANYAYTKHSDLDVHIIVDHRDVECDQPVDALFDTKRHLWKLKHNITVYGIPVEMYVEDLNRPVTGSSYSLIRDHWDNKPQATAPHLPGGVDGVAQAWITIINTAIAGQDEGELESVKHLLKLYRQAGLAKQGEFGRANIVFKTLRNNGKIGQLMKAMTDAEDRHLSLD